MSTISSTNPLDLAIIVPQMLDAARGTLESKWPEVRAFAEKETKCLAETLSMICKLRLTGEITEKQSELQLRIQRNASLAVLTAIEGIGIIMAEEAIQSALGVVSGSVNRIVGFSLL